jgi:hypothetical protein
MAHYAVCHMAFGGLVERRLVEGQHCYAVSEAGM